MKFLTNRFTSYILFSTVSLLFFVKSYLETTIPCSKILKTKFMITIFLLNLKNISWKKTSLLLCKNDLLLLFHQFKGSTDGLRNDLQPYTVQSKVESHLPFGLEKMTSQELAYAWMATLVRPNSLLAQLRSHAISQGNKD